MVTAIPKAMKTRVSLRIANVLKNFIVKSCAARLRFFFVQWAMPMPQKRVATMPDKCKPSLNIHDPYGTQAERATSRKKKRFSYNFV